MPAHVELTRIGRVDHHVLEPTLVWGALALLLSAVRRDSVLRGAACGLVLGLLFATSPTALLGAALVGGAALVLAPRWPRVVSAPCFAAAAAPAALAACSGTLARFSLDESSGLQPLVAAALGVLVLASAPLAALRARVVVIAAGAALC